MQMTRLKMYVKFTWLCTTSMFLPTALMNARVEEALRELEAAKR
jgi:hypothetical protein